MMGFSHVVKKRAPEYTFELTGGRLCLDFANTVDNRPSQRRKELLNNYFDLVSWSRQAGAVPDSLARQLFRKGSQHPGEAGAILRRATDLREAIYRSFSAVAAKHTVPTPDIAKLNSAISEAFRRLQIGPAKHGFTWEWHTEPASLNSMLWPVVRSAAELLTSSDLGRIRECAAENCGWLFMDHSKNQSRRWCDMKVCGNRNKARRYRQWQKAAS